ncbi:MAG: serine/threonine-protein kinase [Kofleriaceae bacterium]
MASAPNFGRYKVTSTLGAGAMGEVYAAVDEVLGREVAVKTLRGAATGIAAQILDDRFRMEARAIAKLTHPSVVQVFDIDLSANPPYLVMERVIGPSLKEQLAQGPLGVTDLRALGIQISRALAAAHAAGVVHRDVKPANILVAGDRTWKLADFGVAHVPDSSLTLTGQFVGSPAYAAPEALIRGQSIPAGDVFGLGASLFQAATGRWPRAEAASVALLAAAPPVRELAPGLPIEVGDAIDRALANDPAHRPSAAELADALSRAPLPDVPPVSLAHATVPGPIAHAMSGVPLAHATTVAAPVAVASTRWKPWAIAGAFVALIITIAATRGSSARAAIDPIDGQIRVDRPPMRDGKAAKDWSKLLEHLERGKIDEALHRLDEWERRHGETPETEALRRQLEPLRRDD